MTSQDTFEHAFRQRLLDVIYAQWGQLGAPFSDRRDWNEVIDPEALFWCSLEFLPTEPRLSETLLEWLGTNKEYYLRQRVKRLLRDNDPRATVWHAIDTQVRSPKTGIELPSEPTHGLVSPTEVVDFALSIQRKIPEKGQAPTRIGRFATGNATLLLRARDLLGHDIRHFLLVYLLANPGGGRLKTIRAWSGHSYRGLSDAAIRWETGKIVNLESGYCRLIASEPFRALLHIKSAKIALVSWLTVFDISVRLLRDLAKARQKNFDGKSKIVETLQREAAAKLSSLLPTSENDDSALSYLLRSFPPNE